jgi:hypothetical protein
MSDVRDQSGHSKQISNIERRTSNCRKEHGAASRDGKTDPLSRKGSGATRKLKCGKRRTQRVPLSVIGYLLMGGNRTRAVAPSVVRRWMRRRAASLSVIRTKGRPQDCGTTDNRTMGTAAIADCGLRLANNKAGSRLQGVLPKWFSARNVANLWVQITLAENKNALQGIL